MIPLAYVPTIITFVDDHQNFLDSLMSCLEPDGFTYECFTDPRDALEKINNSKLCNRKLECFSDKGSTDIGKLQQNLQDTERFQRYSVVISDYSMPPMDGLAFLDKIQDRNIKKVLLTGDSNERIATEALRQGKIDAYINKNDVMLSDVINACVRKLSNSFWCNLTQSIVDTFAHNRNISFDGNHLKEYVEGIINKHSIAEYYLIDAFFTFLLVDERGVRYTLWIQSVKEADAFYATIKGLDESVFPEKLKEEIAKHQKMFCGNLEGRELSKVDNWEKYLKPAIKIDDSLVGFQKNDGDDFKITSFWKYRVS